MCNYENMYRVQYDGNDSVGNATFIPVCKKCGRFVKADKTVTVNMMGEFKDKYNATCSKCGRTEMLFEGFM